ncbi:HAD family hydrolase [Chondrinema litorale]|uniref:HAD family hydrolase n=1 Tax=Chondrinema litorale TaxID=2994555 RepID=UPI002542E8AB|nr:HAD-IA family hydrolase [Chondrinema litorale]UZR93880.1 HAD-IA family hydrolase [Chondrinema litorale]
MILEISPNAKGLIFDLDGTLADTMPSHYLSWKSIADAQKFEFTEDFFYSLAGVPTQKICLILNEKYGLNLDPIKTEEEKEGTFLEIIGETLKPVTAVVDVLKKYHGKMPVACGTGNIKEIALLTLDYIGLQGYFDIIVTAEDVSHPKPHPETFLKCAEQMGVEPQFCQVFEDGEPGLKAAIDGGMIPTDVRPYYELRK